MHKEIIKIKTQTRNQLIDITEKIKQAIKASKTKEGICLVFVPHATAAIMLFENADPALCDDFVNHMSKTIPKGMWKHDQLDGNGDSHIKSGIVGCSEIIPVKDQKPALGRWQGVTLCEFDGPRERTIEVQVLP